MQDQVLKTLVEMYIDREWIKIHRPPQALFRYVDIKKEKDHNKKDIMFFKINPVGISFIEKWMRSMGRETGPLAGIAVQRRGWDHVESHPFTERSLTSAFKKLCEIADVPMEKKRDMYGRRVVIVKDIDVALSRVGYEIKWETNKDIGTNYLKYKLRWSDATVWLWKYLDGLRKELRKIPLQQEFVIWGEFLTDAEAAKYLKLPLDVLKLSEVHKCPDGYHEDVLSEFCAKHGIPVGDHYNSIAVGGPGDDPEIIWTETIEEALYKMNIRTRVLFLSDPNETVWNLLKTTGTRLILVGHESDLCHLNFPTWEEAKTGQEMYFSESRSREEN